MKVGTSSWLFGVMSIVALLCDVTSLFGYETEEIQNLIEEETGHFFPGKNDLDTMLQKERSVRNWLRRVNRASRWYNEKLSQATWNYETNITKTSSEQLANLSEWFDQWTLRRAKEARQYLKSQYRFKRDTFRQLKFRAMSATPDDAGILKQIYSQREHMATAYASAKVCRNTKCLSLEPELIKIMAESRDPDELLWAWHGWRNAAGRPVRNNFKTYMELLNIGAKQNGYANFGEFLREKNYEFSSYTEGLADKLWQQMKPLYSQLHAYVRRRLQQFYGPAVFGNCSTTIPAHILGNMWAQSWRGIYNLVVPFPDTDYPDIDKIFKQENLDPLQLQKKAEEFYVSLGFEPMSRDFWTKSIFAKSSKTLMDCHPTAFDFHKTEDFRVKMCTGNVSSSYYWRVAHHEMGHLVYYMAYKGQPDIYRNPANAALDEAVGDTIAMSSLTFDHMRRLGFTQDRPLNQYESNINLLMHQALEKIPMIAFSYMLEKWRWDVYRGIISPSNYTESWIRMRRHYQGIHPPLSRSESDFDPGSKYHIAVDIPYIRYFFSAILQYQIHEALCEAAENTGPLYHCDISNSKAAGEKLRSFMRLGSSLPWPKSLKMLTGRLSISTQPIHSYYDSLVKWLEVQNRAENVTLWTGEENETC